MEKGRMVQLSGRFWNGYKLLLKEKTSLAELKRKIETTNDILFFKKECDNECDVFTELRQLETKKLNSLIDILLTTMFVVNEVSKMLILKKILTIFLGNYSCFAKGCAKEKSKEIMLYFVSSIGESIPMDENLEYACLEMLDLFLSSRNIVKNKEAFIRPVVFKLVCLYASLAVSDREGAERCKNLGKELSFKWNKSTPELVTLSILKRRERNSKLPICERELLEKYSF